MNNELKINTNDLKKLITMASKDVHRDYLTGIRFHSGRMFATDGHALTIVYNSALSDELNPWMLTASDVKALPKNTEVWFDLVGKKLIGTNFSYDLKRVNELNLYSFIPKDTIPSVSTKDDNSRFNQICFNPELLLKACKAHPELNAKSPSIRIEFKDHLSPICVFNSEKLIAVVMPTRM